MKEPNDYLHFYLGQQFVLKINDTDSYSAPMYLDADALNAAYSNNSADKIYPILLLRTLSDMTEEEWRIIKIKFSIGVYEAYHSYIRYGDRPKHVLILENRLNTNTLTFNDGMILLRLGFDLFRLIENGFALNKNSI